MKSMRPTAPGDCGCGDRCPALAGLRCGCGCPCAPASRRPVPRALAALAAAAAADGEVGELRALAAAGAGAAGMPWAGERRERGAACGGGCGLSGPPLRSSAAGGGAGGRPARNDPRSPNPRPITLLLPTSALVAVDPDTCWLKRTWAGDPGPAPRAALAVLADAALAARPPAAAALTDVAADAALVRVILDAVKKAESTSPSGGGCSGGKQEPTPSLRLPLRGYAVAPLLPPGASPLTLPLGVLAVASPDAVELSAAAAAALAGVARRAAAALAKRAARAADAATASGLPAAAAAAAAPTAVADAGEAGWPLLAGNAAWTAALGPAAARTPLWSLLRPREPGAASGDALATLIAGGTSFTVPVSLRGGAGGEWDAVVLPRPPLHGGGDGGAAPVAKARSHAPARPPRLGPAAVVVVLTRSARAGGVGVGAVLDAVPDP